MGHRMKKWILVAALLSASAFAQVPWNGSQNTIIVVPPVDPYAAAIIQWETYLALAPRAPAPVTIDAATIWIRCGYVESAIVHYTNGREVKTVAEVKTEPANRKQLAALVATGKVVVIDEDEDEASVAACPP
jgi:hypothetical protein